MKQDNFTVITGGPGAGKTTLIRELQHRGYHCVDEVARQLIAEQVACGGTALPWKDKEQYKQLMLERSVTAYHNTPACSGPVFFDRGIPDTICYAVLEGLLLTGAMERHALDLRYNKQVFILPPWKAIYHTDQERKQSWEEAVLTYALMKQTYLEYGYEPVDVPAAPPGYRAAFILEACATGK